MDGKQRWIGSVFQIADATILKLHWPSCVLVRGTFCGAEIFWIRNASDWDVGFEVGWRVLLDAVEDVSCYAALNCIH